MTNYFLQPLLLKPGFSKKLMIILTISQGGGVILLWMLALPIVFKGIITLLLGVNLWQIVKYQLLFIEHPLYNSMLYANTVFLLQNNQLAWLDNSSYAHPWLIILRARKLAMGIKQLKKQEMYSLVLFPDALDEQTFHILQVRLKHRF